MTRIIARYIDNPLKLIDMVYANSCAIDLMRSPAIFTRFCRNMNAADYGNRPKIGFEVFKAV
jgi:hypothetical protein